MLEPDLERQTTNGVAMKWLGDHRLFSFFWERMPFNVGMGLFLTLLNMEG